MIKKTVVLVGVLVTALFPISNSWSQFATEPPSSESTLAADGASGVQVAQAGAAKRAAPTAATEGEQTAAERVNAWTVGVAGGLLEGTFIRFAAELAKALDDGEKLRVLPIVSFGAVENVSDLLYLKGVDIAITDADVLEEYKKDKKFGNIDKRIQYISEMYNADLHIFVRPEIKTIKDLEGKKVGMNTKGSAANLTGRIAFERMGVTVEQVFINNSIALEKMKTGELAGFVHAVGTPNGLFSKMKDEASLGFHFLPVPYSDKFADYYLPSTLTAKDYPTLIKPDEKVETIAVPVVLAVYNWQPGTDRFRRVERFIQYYFERFDTLRKPPYHPKWQEINLGATVPGWTRYWVADNILKQKRIAGASAAQTTGTTETSARQDGPQDERLYKEFLEWKQKNKKQ